MHDRLEEVLEDKGHEVDKMIVQEEDVIGKVRKNDYDVVHLYFTPFLNLRFFLRLLKFNLLSDKQVFVNYYNIKPENLFRRTMKRTFLPLLCYKVILPSRNMEEFYRDVIGIDNTATLRPIVEDKFYNIESDGDKVIYFGHARDDKGIDRIISIASKENPIHCYFIQKKELVYDLFPEIKEKVTEEKIILHDELPVKALSEAKVSLFPFHNLEKTVDIPLALVESLAAGVPVLTSDISPVNDLVPEEMIVENWEKIDYTNLPSGANRESVKDFKKNNVYQAYLEVINKKWN